LAEGSFRLWLPCDVVSGSKPDEALAAAKIVGLQSGFVPVVVVPGDRPGRVGEMPGTKFIGKYLLKPFGLG